MTPEIIDACRPTPALAFLLPLKIKKSKYGLKNPGVVVRDISKIENTILYLKTTYIISCDSSKNHVR